MKPFTKLSILLWVLALCMIVQSTQASVVNVGNYTKGRPGDVQACQTFLNGFDDLGVDPDGPTKNAAFNDLADPLGATTMFFFDDTVTIPGDLCTGLNQCPTWAVTLCGQKSMHAINIRLARDTDGNPLWCRFDCSESGQAGDKNYWVFAACP